MNPNLSILQANITHIPVLEDAFKLCHFLCPVPFSFFFKGGKKGKEEGKIIVLKAPYVIWEFLKPPYLF